MSSLSESLQGLTSADAEAALQRVGPNALPEKAPITLWQRWLAQFKSPLIYILIVALLADAASWAFDGAHGLPAESLAILVILLLNASLGVWQERKSESALAKLKALAAPQSWVMRDGQLQQIASYRLVPGDVLRLEAGERIPADGNFLQTGSVSVDESMLTGESMPVDKQANDAAFAGTLMARGKGWIRVTRTGEQSSMGQLSHLLESVEEQITPLEMRIRHFGNRVAIFVVSLALVLVVTGTSLLGLSHLTEVFLFAVALAVAAVPESLPAVMTLAMALGMERMADRKAVVRKLSAVEALGSVTVIATDKTGTLTENAMRVESIDTDDNKALLLQAMLQVNDASLEDGVGDPLELGLLRFAREQGASLSEEGGHRVSEKPFDSTWKYMRVTVADAQGQTHSWLKGAPEVILARCQLSSALREHWQGRIEAHASKGYRALAFASGPGENETDLQWLGLALLWDPPRAEVPAAIAKAKAAGIRVLMMTGDHPATARVIAANIGIDATTALSGEQLSVMSEDEFAQATKSCSVFARVQPEHKLRLVETLRAQNQVVAVTGDGVNDAPALKAADVGVAMGKRGSDVSREVADLVLLDDNFATIVAAIEEGRNIYANLLKFIRLLFSANLAEIVLIGIGAIIAFASTPEGVAILLPLTAIQILWINLLTDSLPAISIALDRNGNVLSQAPRVANAPLFDRPSLYFILAAGIGIGGLSLLMAYVVLPALGFTELMARSIVFTYLVFSQLVLVFPARRLGMDPQPNRYVMFSVIAAFLLQVLVMVLPWSQHWLEIENLGALAWAVVAGLVLLTVAGSFGLRAGLAARSV